jgi:hypothetical protein
VQVNFSNFPKGGGGSHRVDLGGNLNLDYVLEPETSAPPNEITVVVNDTYNNLKYENTYKYNGQGGYDPVPGAASITT